VWGAMEGAVPKGLHLVAETSAELSGLFSCRQAMRHGCGGVRGT
jgi:hypothetical protein